MAQHGGQRVDTSTSISNLHSPWIDYRKAQLYCPVRRDNHPSLSRVPG
jgi:hypothetical protein